jgi:hypothetical protein
MPRHVLSGLFESARPREARERASGDERLYIVAVSVRCRFQHGMKGRIVSRKLKSFCVVGNGVEFRGEEAGNAHSHPAHQNSAAVPITWD